MVDSVRVETLNLEVLAAYDANHLRNRLRALVARRDWNEIEDIAKNKKSPIGWEVSKNTLDESASLLLLLLLLSLFQGNMY